MPQDNAELPTDAPAVPPDRGAGVPPDQPVDRPVTKRDHATRAARDHAVHTAGPVVPSPHRRAPARFSWVGVALLGAAAVVAFTLTLGVFLPAIGALGDAARRDPANLPDRITVCEREWTRDTVDRTFTRDEILARTDAEPIVVSTGLAPACPPEVSAGGDAGGTATVVYAQIGDDAYVPYTLVGAP